MIVRYQLAFSIGEFNGAGAPTAEAVAALIASDGTNSWMQTALLSSVNGMRTAVFTKLAADEQRRRLSHVQQILSELARQIGASGRVEQVDVVIAAIGRFPAGDKALIESVVMALVAEEGHAGTRFRNSNNAAVQNILLQVIQTAKATAADSNTKLPKRVAAIRRLSLAAEPALFDELLNPRQLPAVQTAALQTLARFKRPDVADRIILRIPTFSPAVRSTAVETLLSRPEWVQQLFAAIQCGKVRRGVISQSRIQLLRKYPDPRVSKLATVLFSDTRVSARSDVVASYQPALSMAGNAERGKAVFKKNCSACHKLDGIGSAIGAELKGIGQRGAASVMLNILDPNREVKPGFVAYTIVQDDGRILTGMIVRETANDITVRQADGTTRSVRRAAIEEMHSSQLSFMPEGLEKSIDVKAMADLLSYLIGE